jgi:hypothetical protein
VRLDRLPGVAIGAPDEPLDDLRLAHGPAQLAQHHRIDRDRKALSISTPSQSKITSPTGIRFESPAAADSPESARSAAR